MPDSELTPGNCRLVIASASGSPSVSTQEPSGVMPIATTSNRCGSRLRRMLPADTHEMACSLLRPPKTTATRTRSLALTTGEATGWDALGLGGGQRPGVSFGLGAAAQQQRHRLVHRESLV